MANKSEVKSLKLSSDFVKITKEGRKVKITSYLTLFLSKSDDTSTYFGMTISRKVGNAVLRNKLKRWVRHSVRTNQWLDKYKGQKVVFMFRSQPEGFYQNLNYKKFFAHICE